MNTFSILVQLLLFCVSNMTQEHTVQKMCNKYVVLKLILLSSISATFCTKSRVKNCDTANCKDLTESIAASIDVNTNPCDDFYQHACGRWSQSHVIPPNAIGWTAQHIILDRVNQRLDGLLKEVNFENKDPLEIKAKVAYDACQDSDYIAAAGIPLLFALTEDLGGWPMTKPPSQRNNTRHCWQKIHAGFGAMIGQGALLTLNVEEDTNNHGKPTLYLDQPTELFKGINLMTNIYEEQAYAAFVKTLLEAFVNERGVEITDEYTIDEDIQKLIEFRKHLQEIMSWGNRRRDITRMHNPTTIKDLEDWNVRLHREKNAVLINWKKLIEATIQFTRNVNVTEEELVNIHETRYIINLLPLLAKTDEEVIVNHIHLFFVENYLKYTNTEMRNLVLRMHHGDVDIPAQSKRWKACLATHPMKHVLSLMYIDKYFPDSSRDEVRQVLHDVRQTFIEEIKKSIWLRSPVKRKAVKKLENVQFTIGYPDWYRNKRSLIDFYDGQDVTDMHLYNVLSYDRAAYRREIEQLSPLNSQESAKVFPIDVEMHYRLQTNELEVTAASMQQPFYSEKLLSVLLYGTTGFILAHELSHAFDLEGRLYNEYGSRENWWDDETRTEYNKRVQCIMNQYNKFPVVEIANSLPLLHTDTRITVREDFADNLGFDIAYRTYKNKRGNADDVSAKIPTLSLIAENKLFFYAFAQVHCEKTTLIGIIQTIDNDDHSLQRFRINGPLMNSPEFSATFGCPKGSFMNPKEKCFIWNK